MPLGKYLPCRKCTKGESDQRLSCTISTNRDRVQTASEIPFNVFASKETRASFQPTRRTVFLLAYVLVRTMITVVFYSKHRLGRFGQRAYGVEVFSFLVKLSSVTIALF